MPQWSFSLAALLLATFTLPIASRAATACLHPEGFDAAVEAYKSKGLSDGSVVVAYDDVPIFRKSVGFANREWSVPNSSRTIFRVGSITKQFTAAAVLSLVADGKLSLDAPVSRYIKGIPPSWSKVTVRHLLTHTSGIPDFTAQPEFNATWIGRPTNDVMALVSGLPLEATPGTKFSYDNTGYVLLGSIVERASGQPFASYVKARFLKPLEMRSTGFVSEQVLAGRAFGYVNEDKSWTDTDWMSNIQSSGAGALYSTTDDLLKWDKALVTGKALPEKYSRLMFTDFGHGYGFGYVIERRDGHRVLWHNGHVNGFASIMARYPDDHITVVALSNDDGAQVEDLARDLASRCFTNGEQHGRL